MEVVAAVLQLEKLRLARPMELVLLHDGVRALSIAEPVSRPVAERYREVKGLQHARPRMKRVLQEAGPNERLLINEVLEAPSLDHASVERGSQGSLLRSEVRRWKHRFEKVRAVRLNPRESIAILFVHMYIVFVVLDALVGFASCNVVFVIALAADSVGSIDPALACLVLRADWRLQEEAL